MIAINTLIVAAGLINPVHQIGENPPLNKIWPGYGVQIHFSDPRTTEIAKIKEAGFRYVRLDFRWEKVEQARGSYDFSEYDRFFDAIKKSSIKPIFVLNYGNTLYENGAPSTENAQEAFAQFAAESARHFKNEDVLWEIWNEPNSPVYWKPKPDASTYSNLAILTARAMKVADQGCRVMAPAVSGIDIPYIERALTKELLSVIDAVSVHPYRTRGPESVWEEYKSLRAYIRKTAPADHAEMPIIASEWGYTTARGGVSESRQAMFLVRSFLVNSASGNPVSIFYDWKDDGPDSGNLEHRYGVVTQDLTGKPSYVAAKGFLDKFAGLTDFKKIPSKDVLRWIVVGAGQNRLVRASWKLNDTELPKYEALSLSKKANRDMYQALTGGYGTDSGRGRPAEVPEKPITTLPLPSGTDPLKMFTATGLDISFAPPHQNRGWCALVRRKGTSNSKLEIKYVRSETGAKVSCYINANSARVLESLESADASASFNIAIGGKTYGPISPKLTSFLESEWESRKYSGETFQNRDVLTITDAGLSCSYGAIEANERFTISPKSDVSIPEGAKRLILWVKTDGSSNLLKSRFRRESGEVFEVDLGILNSASDRGGWRVVVIPLNDSGGTGRRFWSALLTVSKGEDSRGGTLEIGSGAYEF
jgi:hypothetical protein